MWCGLRRLQCREHFVGVDVTQHVEEDHCRDADNGDAQQDADPIPADRVLEKSRHRAQRIEHHSSGLTPVISVLNVANAMTLVPADP